MPADAFRESDAVAAATASSATAFASDVEPSTLVLGKVVSCSLPGYWGRLALFSGPNVDPRKNANRVAPKRMATIMAAFFDGFTSLLLTFAIGLFTADTLCEFIQYNVKVIFYTTV